MTAHRRHRPAYTFTDIHSHSDLEIHRSSYSYLYIRLSTDRSAKAEFARTAPICGIVHESTSTSLRLLPLIFGGYLAIGSQEAKTVQAMRAYIVAAPIAFVAVVTPAASKCIATYRQQQ